MFEALQFDFMQNALLAGLLASLICGVMGTMAVVNRIVFLSGGIAHAAFGGIGLAFFFGWHYLVGTIGFSVAAALAMALITLKAKHRADTIIGVIWALGMAIPKRTRGRVPARYRAIPLWQAMPRYPGPLTLATARPDFSDSCRMPASLRKFRLFIVTSF